MPATALPYLRTGFPRPRKLLLLLCRLRYSTNPQTGSRGSGFGGLQVLLKVPVLAEDVVQCVVDYLIGWRVDECRVLIHLSSNFFVQSDRGSNLPRLRDL